jgi:GTP cyclohydrolase II
VFGIFDLVGFECANLDKGRTESALLLMLGNPTSRAPLLRIHSQCLTGEVLGSLRCDCRGQLELAMSAIANEGSGLVIYEYQEGCGIGLMEKLKAYTLQDQGLNTIEANHVLGFDADCRDFSLAVTVLRELNIQQVRLMSNNPQKVEALTKSGIESHRADCLRSTGKPLCIVLPADQEEKAAAFAHDHVNDWRNRFFIGAPMSSQAPGAVDLPASFEVSRVSGGN